MRSKELDLEYTIKGEEVVFEDGVVYDNNDIRQLKLVKSKSKNPKKIMEKIHLLKKEFDCRIGIIDFN